MKKQEVLADGCMSVLLAMTGPGKKRSSRKGQVYSTSLLFLRLSLALMEKGKKGETFLSSLRKGKEEKKKRVEEQKKGKQRLFFMFSQSSYLGGTRGLLLVLLTTLGDTLQDLLTVLVELELGDDDLGGSDAEGNRLAVGLLAGDTLDVDDPLETVDGCDLALTALVAATDNGDLVVLADGDGADLFGGEGC
jgi:hypothetical protein